MNTEIYEKCKNLVIQNVKQPLPDEIIEILTASSLALMLKNPKRTLKKLPEILREINIIADSRSVLEIAHEELNNYQEDQKLQTSDACVTRSIKYDEETGILKEEKTLILSLKRKQIYGLIEKVTHELSHLLRFKGISQQDNIIKVLDGISISRYNIETGTLKRKHYNLEEGIVEKYSNEATEALYNFLKECPQLVENHPYLKQFTKEFPQQKQRSCYPLHTDIIGLLCQNPTFAETIETSFEETTTPSSMATYYNDVTNSTSGFSRLSKKVDSLIENANEQNIETATILIDDIYKDIQIFLLKANQKKY